MPSPLPSRILHLLEFSTPGVPTAKLSLPSPLKSPTATVANSADPGAKFWAGSKVPWPLLKSTDPSQSYLRMHVDTVRAFVLQGSRCRATFLTTGGRITAWGTWRKWRGKRYGKDGARIRCGRCAQISAFSSHPIARVRRVDQEVIPAAVGLRDGYGFADSGRCDDGPGCEQHPHAHGCRRRRVHGDPRSSRQSQGRAGRVAEPTLLSPPRQAFRVTRHRLALQMHTLWMTIGQR